MCFVKKEICDEMRLEKLYNFVKALCCGCFQKGEILCNAFSYGQNFVVPSFVYFENKKCEFREKQTYVSCRAFHAASNDVFQFLIKWIISWKRNNKKNTQG